MNFFKVSFLTSIKAFKNKALTFIFVLTMTVLFSVVIVVMQENIFANGQKPQVLNLALVNEDDSEKTRLLLKVAQNTKEFKSTINLVYCEKLDTATNMLQKGEVSGVAVLPKGFLDSVLVGENLSPTLFISTASPLETLCIKTLADSLVKTLSAAQAGIYTVIDAKESVLNQYPNQNFINKINLEYFGGVLSRTDAFDLKKVSPTGILSVFEHFAICIFI
ncbi:MAG: ABC transporter permease, partial [Oscillospiraceae bacterium]